MKTINEDVEMEEETPEAQKYIVSKKTADARKKQQ
jgi:hypothetical protein